MINYPAKIADYRCGQGERLLVIAGPCVIESESLTLRIAAELADGVGASDSARVQGLFRQGESHKQRHFRGAGLEEGLRILSRVKSETGLPVTTDIHESSQASGVAEVCDLLQIPAFLARQTDLLASTARTGRAVNVKKGQFMAPWDMRHVVDKLVGAGCSDVLVCERGTFFGYGRLVNDMRALVQMRGLGVPVVFDATHSVQEPGGLGVSTGGNRAMVEPLARAATAVGIDGLFCEVHPEPDQSPSDGPNIVPLGEFGGLLRRLLAIRDVVDPFPQSHDA